MSTLQTQLDRGESASDQARADVAAYLERTGNADLIEILGLGDGDEPDVLVIDEKICCPACRKPYPDDGRRACRKTTCRLGPKARKAAE